MDLGPLRQLALTVNLNVLGVDATVTRPAPDNTPIMTRGIWSFPLGDQQEFGVDFKRREPRRVLVLPREDVPTMPSGTLISAAEAVGGTPRTWRFDGHDAPAESGYWRAIVTLVRS